MPTTTASTNVRRAGGRTQRRMLTTSSPRYAAATTVKIARNTSTPASMLSHWVSSRPSAITSPGSRAVEWRGHAGGGQGALTVGGHPAIPVGRHIASRGEEDGEKEGQERYPEQGAPHPIPMQGQ